MGPSAAKAVHYIQLLDDARCDGNWDAIPELVRKIRKHAPERSCLALTAETEHAIAKAAQHVAPSTRPTTAVAQQDVASLLERLPKVLAASEEEQKNVEDEFQAQVCVGWLHWVAGQYDVTATQLPTEEAFPHLDSTGTVSTWTKVCALKSAYLKANCLTRGGMRTKALAQFSSALRSLSSGIWKEPSSKKQVCYWSELFLTEYCMLFSQSIEEHEEILTDPNCLACFRSWANYWDMQRGANIGGFGFRGSIPRRRIWLAYYDVLSELLKQDLPFPTGYAPGNNDSSVRAQLQTELKKVEVTYEGLLIGETTFPRADEERVEVERFVELVMENWKILNGRGWRDNDLGRGGKDTLSRGVLGILYRAATKTFHSTAILRYLFVVHLAVAEFDLAFKSFDSYMELVNKGQARVEKTGHSEPSLDGEVTVLETLSSCIIALCRYGDRQAAEKARHLATELEERLEKPPSRQSQPTSDTIREEGPSPYTEDVPAPAAVHEPISLAVLALSWQAIGLAHAQWARMTFDSASRSDIQKKAIQCLEKSLSSEFGKVADVRGIFALGLLLAEQRELATAIELVKTALLADKVTTPEDDLYHGAYWRERALVPLWHLLSLMLSARQDYLMAARACEGAFEQFKDPTVLFGTKSLNGYRSDHLNEVTDAKAMDAETGGVVDDMDDYEKERILEVKMTQLALVELLEGPKVAVNASVELLTLYSRLFGVPHEKPNFISTKADVPKSSAGTLRSIKGSIFHRHGHGHERSSRTRHSMALSEKTITGTRPPTAQAVADESLGPALSQIAINGTDNRRSRHSLAATGGGELPGGKLHSLRKRESSGSRTRALNRGAVSHQPSVVDGDAYFTPYEDPPSNSHDFFTVPSRRFPSGSRPSESNGAGSTKPNLAGIAVEKLEPYPVLLPAIQFSEAYHIRRRTAILIQVWLMTAGFYRRAAMYEDAQAAVVEANKLVQTLEADASKDPTGGAQAGGINDAGTVSLKHAGWAGKKSVEELWGDVWSEKGNLSLAKGLPYIARSDFESALTHYPDHPAAIVGLSDILLDIYTEDLLPPPAVPGLNISPASVSASSASSAAASTLDGTSLPKKPDHITGFPSGPLGLRKSGPTKNQVGGPSSVISGISTATSHVPETHLPPPYKAKSLPLVDRLAARDRAYGLLSGLTKLGAGWNYSEAWFALARAHEESGQTEKAKEVLWWCVELEGSMGVREWGCVGAGGYVL